MEKVETWPFEEDGDGATSDRGMRRTARNSREKGKERKRSKRTLHTCMAVVAAAALYVVSILCNIVALAVPPFYIEECARRCCLCCVVCVPCGFVCACVRFITLVCFIRTMCMCDV